MHIFREIKWVVQELTIGDVPHVKIEASEEYADIYDPLRSPAATSGEGFNLAAELSRASGKRIVYYSILYYALRNPEFLKLGRVLKVGNRTIAFVPEQNMTASDIHDEARVFLKDDIIIDNVHLDTLVQLRALLQAEES
jgi:hypothetical protein